MATGNRKPRFAHGPVGRFFRELGPGLITGAADDDPSGISTYSVTGATFGFAQLWTALFSFSLMTAVQLMCARLIVANTINIGADLSGMAEAMEMMTGLHALVWTPLFAGLIVVLLIWSSYRHIAHIFKWL